DDEHDVGLLDRAELGLPRSRRLGSHVAALLPRRQELPAALEPLKGERLGVEDPQRLRLAELEVAAEALRVLLAADDDDAVVEAPLVEPVLPVDRRAHDLDPLLQERLCVALGVLAALRQERDSRRGPEGRELAEQARHPRVARAAVGVGHAVVDHEEAVERLRVARSQHLAWLLRGLDDARAPREPLAPALDEQPAVALHPPARALGAARAVQEVHDPRARLVDRAEAPLAHPEAEIGVLEVARREELVEPAQLQEELRRAEQAGRRAEVDLPAAAMLEVARVAVA